jgi:hypothetical protein
VQFRRSYRPSQRFMNTFRLFSRSYIKRPFASSFFRPPSAFAAPRQFRSFHYFRPSFQRYQYARFGDPPGKASSGAFQNFWARLTPGQRLLVVGVGGGAPVFYVTHLETVQETGRRRFIFMSRSMEEAMGKMVTPSLPSRLTKGFRADDAAVQGSIIAGYPSVY